MSSTNIPNDDIDSVYGTNFYSNPLTNPEYAKTLKDMNVDQFIYDLIAKSDTSTNKPLISSIKSKPHYYEGNKVITESILIQNLQVDSLKGMTAPQYFSEPGYLCSFLLAVNDPLMSIEVFVRGQDESGYSLANYSIRKMAMLGMGMTLGEAEELIYTDEGQTSRDISGHTSAEHPYIARYKHLPTGTETDYEKYKGTEDDAWCVISFEPKDYVQFNTLFFDIYNANSTGARLIHYLEIRRFIIITDKMADTVPPYNKSLLSLPPLSTADVVPAVTPLDPVSPPTVSSSYTKRTMRKLDENPMFVNVKNGMYSINKDQQDNQLFKDIVDTNHQMFNELLGARFKKAKRLKKT